MRNGFYATVTIGGLVFGTYYYMDSRSAIHSYVTMPLMHTFTDPETSHNLAVKAMSWGITPKDQVPDHPSLAFELWGKKFSNPIGLAAGLDKQAEAIDGLFNLGFSYVEIGSVTPLAQPGNEKPRYFRLPEDSAVINRYGFNSDGHNVIALRLRNRIRNFLFHNHSTDAAAHELAANPTGSTATNILSLPRSLLPGKVLAINLGKNKNGDEVEDYVKGVQQLGRFADVLVINVSSPNTPGLRDLQHGDSLRKLLSAVVKERNASSPTVPICVKIAPDLSEKEIKSIASAILDTKVDGCIISNTTISRPSSLTPVKTLTEQGGLSGPPLKPLTLQALKTMRQEVGRKCVLIACGGVTTGRDVLDYGLAGASFVQGYTAFGYDGVRYPRRLKDELLAELQGRNWRDIIGASV
ncbi:Dihydroorotate dehydrogenase,mitochondrial [Taphrina deformans PYCC 5710]|uniref:Dihydroorotate dehydrogenase (quinone), mitochondrial n=1 Tax=Taphrina deformans (strain PYCC 5710 / ATCC 11124 / CBS 356.35 / IMI 108563 / JCM 9778 / NBRC 8474) TaxID=1097556 RepID=R4XF08_TAPDE|nr:Dihydroorotate dehydrogenase,mitochondrial [Taphrina deformans PYCC 5710]|eukprot:CCG81947.1 Dihydroorotate dehydrogenase,mitochondrial [Taphrina deformans PYCC 5710]